MPNFTFVAEVLLQLVRKVFHSKTLSRTFEKSTLNLTFSAQSLTFSAQSLTFSAQSLTLLFLQYIK
jgi:hypothetical protein